MKETEPSCRFARTPDTGSTLRQEPFRLFFPFGLVASVLGVLLWPLLYAGWIPYYPHEAHARLMIEGFVGCFAMGFLATAFPKMIESPPLIWAELIGLLVLMTGAVTCHAFGKIGAGDTCFLFAWILLAKSLGARLLFLRRDLPPPGFVLAGLGILSGVIGVSMLLIGRLIGMEDFVRELALLLLYEGFILLPILGIGGFLFPRFLQDSVRAVNGSWAASAWIHLAIGTAVLGTMVPQAGGATFWAPIARGLLVAGFLGWQTTLWRRGSQTGTLSWMLLMAVTLLVVGLLISGSTVAFRVAVKHVLFVGGFGLLILTVATRVIWGHGGRIHLATGKRKILRAILILILLGMATRVVADIIPKIRVSHHIYASLSWVAASAIWAWAVWRAPDKPNC